MRSLLSAIVGFSYMVACLHSTVFTGWIQQIGTYLANDPIAGEDVTDEPACYAYPAKPACKYATMLLADLPTAIKQTMNCEELRRIGYSLYQQFDFVGSLSYYEQALSCYRDVGDFREAGTTLNIIGVLYYEQGRYEDALLRFDEALTIARQINDQASKATTLGNIGSVLHAQGRYQDALASHEAALAIQREINDREGEGYSLNYIGLVYDSQGHNDAALLQFEAALTIWRQLGDRASEGRTLSNIGGIYFEQGRFDSALAQYRSALAIVRKVGDKSSEGVILNNIGLIYSVQGHYEDALERYELALSIARQVGNRVQERIALDNIGSVYLAQGRLEDALSQFEAALAISRDIGESTGEGEGLNSIGAVFLAQGNAEDALIHFEAALAIWREAGNREGEAAALDNIAQVYSTLGRTEDALMQYEMALTIRRAVGDRIGLGKTINNIAGVYRDQGRYSDALAQYELALAIVREMGDRLGEGTIRDNIGQIYSAQGLFDDAMAQYKLALAIRREIGDQVGEGKTLNNIAQVYRVQGNHLDALGQYELALSTFRGIGDRKSEGRVLNNIGGSYSDQGSYEDALATYSAGLTIAREVGDREIEGSILNNIGIVYYTQGRHEEALAQYNAALDIAREVGDREDEGKTLYNIGHVFRAQGRYEDALLRFEEALVLVESIRATAGSEQARMAFVAENDSLFEDTIHLYLKRGRTIEAFFTSERARARTFLDSLATGYVQLDNEELTQLVEQERIGYQVRQDLQVALASARAQHPTDQRLVNTLEYDLAEAEATYDAAVEAIVARGTRLISLIPGRGLDYVLEVDEVQAELPADTTLVSYYLYTDHDDKQQAVAFVVGQRRFEAVPLAVGADELSQVLSDFRAFAGVSDARPKSLRQLYTWLIEPIVNQLTTTRLIIVPHGVLHYLPFAALTNGGPYLGERYLITTLPSASILALLDESQATRRIPLVLGNPTSDAGLPNLPAAEAEARAVAALYGDTAYIGAEATETLVQAQAGQYGALHIASHAAFDSVAPLQSGLYLAADPANDGILHLEEVYGLDLTVTDLVVLSACQTNVGTVSPGDDIMALNRAFLFAGASTVVASLWDVNDEATSILMTRFYTYLDEGWGEAEALRQAQLDLKTERPEYVHPFFWAAFVLSGDGGDVTHPITAAGASPNEPGVPTTALTPPDSTATSQPGLCAGMILPLLLALFVARLWIHQVAKRGRRIS